jgi:hypothetical protein
MENPNTEQEKIVKQIINLIEQLDSAHLTDLIDGYLGHASEDELKFEINNRGYETIDWR